MHALTPRLRSQRRFREWCEAGHRPWYIPALPKIYYGDRNAWVSRCNVATC